MSKNPINKGILTSNSAGVGPVSVGMIHARARELAQMEGRAAPEVTHADYERARRELSGGSDTDPKDALIESMPESMRWNPVPGSAGREVPGAENEDEDDEGRSETEQIVDEGVEEAERDQMLKATQEAQRKDRKGP
jgi:hypothetical protein